MAHTFSLPWLIFSTAYAGYLAGRGRRKKSLSESGAVAAFVVGLIHMYGGLQFGLTITAFYLSATKFTKFKAELKEVIEENYKKASERNAIQVLANSAASTLLVLLYLYNSNGDEPRVMDAISAGILGHFATCCADTWSSEIGVVSNENPRLITNFKTVPKGTNGAISKLGTAAGALGGLFMGLVFWVTRLAMGVGKEHPKSSLGISLVFAGLIFGVLGTLLDSLLGGTLQYTGHSRKLNRVVSKPGPEVTHLSGASILSNDGVNFVSSVVITALAATWGSGCLGHLTRHQ